jgi:predicted anti-sigma-YlaC factor YlaD
MKCLSRIEIQEYIDNEIKPPVKAEIIKHLETCDKCRSQYEKALEDLKVINRLLDQNSAIIYEIPIPDFIPPVENRKNKKYFRLIPVMMAASIIAFIFLFRPGRTPVTVTEKIPEAEILMYQFYEGKDLNKLWHEKTQIIILQDEKGNVIQSIITN